MYSYTFDHLAGTIDALLEQLKINRYTLYLFDYGAPIGYRIILGHPERLHALIVQNGNAYKVGLDRSGPRSRSFGLIQRRTRRWLTPFFPMRRRSNGT